MKFALSMCIVAFVCGAGCVQDMVNHGTKVSTQSISDIYYSQVMFNLATTAENEWAVPSQATFAAGEVSGSNAVAPKASLTFDDGGELANRVFDLTNTLTFGTKWTINPVKGKDLRRLQLWYRWAIGTELKREAQLHPEGTPRPAIDVEETLRLLNALRQQQQQQQQQQWRSLAPPKPPQPESSRITSTAPSDIDEKFLPAPGWLRSGKADRDARYVATYRGITVWVPKSREPDFARFAMLVLDEINEAPALVVSGNSAIVAP